MYICVFSEFVLNSAESHDYLDFIFSLNLSDCDENIYKLYMLVFFNNLDNGITDISSKSCNLWDYSTWC